VLPSVRENVYPGRAIPNPAAPANPDSPDCLGFASRFSSVCPDYLRGLPVGLGSGDAPRGGAAPGGGVDDDRGQKHETGHDVLPLHLRDALQVEAVVDGGDDQAAKHAMERLAPAAEKACAPDDRRGDREEHVLATLQVVR